MEHLFLNKKTMTVAMVTVLLSMNTEVVYTQAVRCKTMNFVNVIRDKALINHTIKIESVSYEGLCRVKCYTNDHCISYNFLISSIDGQLNNCQLSDSDHIAHPKDMKERPNTIYRSAKHNCRCISQGTCRVNFADDTCPCKTPGFTGPNCDQDVSGPCDINPCLNDGTCQVQGTSYTCTCTAQASGDNCQTKVCSSGWRSSQGNCYKIVSKYTTWDVAEKHCVSIGGHLVSIHNQVENTEVAKLIAQEFWIGLSDTETDGIHKMKWTDGTPLDYQNIGTQQSGSKGCFYMEPSTGKWKEMVCTNGSKQFVCMN